MTTPPSFARSRPAALAALLAGLSAGLWAACVPAPALAQSSASPQEQQQQRRMRRMSYDSTRDNASRMPKLDAERLDEVFRMSVEGGHLVCSSALAERDDPRAGQFRVEVPEFDGPTFVRVYTMVGGFRRAPGPGPDTVRTFTFFTHHLGPGDELTTLTLQAQPGLVEITRNTQSDGGGRTVMLVDHLDGTPGREPGGGAQLAVVEYGTGANRTRNVNVRESDFHALLREHPREAGQYIRPLLRELGHEAAMAPDPMSAWQVFADQWPAEERAVRQVRAVLPRLDSPNYRVRERAAAELKGMGRAGAVALLRLDRRGLSPAQNLLIERVLGPFTALPPGEAARLGSDTDFLLDCFYSPERPVRAAALERLKALGDGRAGADLAASLDAPLPVRSAAVAALREKLKQPPATAPATQPGTRPAPN